MLLLTELNAVVHDLYDCISFGPGKRPNFRLMRRIFLPQAHLINANGTQPQLLTLDAFINSIEANLNAGKFTAFEETEVKHTTEVFGKVAHRFSTYEARFTPGSVEPDIVGINSIQFVHADGRWQVSSIAWNDQTPERTLPEQYQPD
ncbi:nuclear transport factor 2 family protein [Solirubrum puertoriconensis]|uniref:DUF4440 domain-containing protein n=1 Tax=Solirubrum puertoriconensis TaxID=1751427 RepID=A0A9X0HJZ7_SOLP1|nr:nuclear transport factor 2 family protein [Solirubrum puertoriconensis]KUG07366.1 hypothetical protein ASU33_13490 [Solirubrum puertoriconensis]